MLTVAIQAGGASRRMGQDKGLLPFLGQPLIQRVIDRLAPAAAEILVTTNRLEAYRFLGVRLVSDALPGRGALGGLYTALQAARQPLVAVVACDMPFASLELIEAQAHLLQVEAWDAVIPHSPTGAEPFHAIYRRETCLPLVEAALQAEQWRVDAWFEQAQVRRFQPDEVARYAPEFRCFQNVNTPDEFQAALERARQEKKSGCR